MKRHIITTIACVAAALAVAGCARTTKTAQHQVSITVARSGALSVAGQQCSPSQLPARLTGFTVKQPVAVLLQADTGAPYKQVVAVLDACTAAGVERVTLATAK
jgi:biopolymer transport protein ExbD